MCVNVSEQIFNKNKEQEDEWGAKSSSKNAKRNWSTESVQKRKKETLKIETNPSKRSKKGQPAQQK